MWLIACQKPKLTLESETKNKSIEYYYFKFNISDLTVNHLHKMCVSPFSLFSCFLNDNQ